MSFLDGPLPTWMLDSESDTCLLCSIPFTFFKRRHHCRTCGLLCCGNCSRTRHYLSGECYQTIYGQIPQRVCDKCDKEIRILTPKKHRPTHSTTSQVKVTTIQMEPDNEQISTIPVDDDDDCVVHNMFMNNDDCVVHDDDDCVVTHSGLSQDFLENIAEEVAFTNTSSYRIPQKILTLSRKAKLEIPTVILEEEEEDEPVKSSKPLVLPVPSKIDSVKISSDTNADQEVKVEEKKENSPVVNHKDEEDKKVVEDLDNIKDKEVKEVDSNELISEVTVVVDDLTEVVETPFKESEPSTPTTTLSSDDSLLNVVSSLDLPTDVASDLMSVSASSKITAAQARIAARRMNSASLKGSLTRQISGNPAEVQGVDVYNASSARSRLRTMRNNSKTMKKANETNEKIVFNTGRAVSVDVFNSLWGQGSAIIIDTRSTADYALGHVPRAINIPMTMDDISEEVPISLMEKRIPIAGDSRIFRMRQRRMILIAGHEMETDNTGVSEEDVASNLYQAPAHPICEYLAQLLLQENRVVSVDILSSGAKDFITKYPFVSCGAGQQFNGAHTHVPIYPGYPSEIIDSSIFLGSKSDASNKEHLEKLGVTHVLNASRETPNYHEETGTFKYLQIELDDVAEAKECMLDSLTKCIEFIDDLLSSNGKVLVHCQMGISRSATVVIAYIMRNYNCSLKEAIAMVRSRRSQILPNPGFLQLLGELERKSSSHDTYDEVNASLYPH